MTVSFNKQQERIRVPFAALSAFVDPSVRFGLQFDRKDKARRKGRQAAPPRRRRCPPPEKRPPLGAPADRARPRRRPRAEPAEREAKPEDAASKIVKLDSFRKK